MSKTTYSPDKRYLLFGNFEECKIGGLNDLLGSYDSYEEAIKSMKTDNSQYDQYQIYDRIDGIEVYRLD